MTQTALRLSARLLPALLMLVAAVPAHAEKLVFDHRIYPPLKAVLDSGDAAMIAFDGSNPRYVVDLIAVQGKSTTDWNEALEIIARAPSKKVSTAQDWLAELNARADRHCPNTVRTIAEDASSITFERSVKDCPAERADTTIGRILIGKRSLFLMTVLVKGVPDAATRQQWLDLLNSAHID